MDTYLRDAEDMEETRHKPKQTDLVSTAEKLEVA